MTGEHLADGVVDTALSEGFSMPKGQRDTGRLGLGGPVPIVSDPVAN